MNRFWLSIILAALAIPFAGCDKIRPAARSGSAASAGGGSTPAQPPHQYPTQAQPKLPTIKLWIGPKVMDTEMALTPIQEETGMMFRTNMGANEGMIFVFPTPMRTSFWMKNTLLPLSVAYIGPDGTIEEIYDLQPRDTNVVDAVTNNIKFVLETPQGWFKTNHIGIGTVITSEHGPLNRVFQ